MSRGSDGVRVTRLTDQDGAHLLAMLAADPIANCFFLSRIAQIGVLRAGVWGAWEGPHLCAAVMLAGNTVPVGSDPQGIAEIGAMLATRGRLGSSLVGLSADVRVLWDALAATWGPARECRWHQPILVADSASTVEVDRQVRLGRPEDLELLFGPTVAMFTEEVGVSPFVGSSEAAYRARLASLIRARRVYCRIDGDEVVFKAEVAAATKEVCQVQGVWVTPTRRGQGIGSAGMAAVVAQAAQECAPLVTLYVNDYNLAARRTYRKAGFTPAGEMASVLF